jgi:hypothetical protein
LYFTYDAFLCRKTPSKKKDSEVSRDAIVTAVTGVGSSALRQGFTEVRTNSDRNCGMHKQPNNKKMHEIEIPEQQPGGSGLVVEK